MPLFLSLIFDNKLGGGTRLTGWGVGVVAGLRATMPVFCLPFCRATFQTRSPTTVPVWAPVPNLTPSFCTHLAPPGPTPAPAMPPAIGYCMIKSSKDSSGFLSRASIPWVPGPPYRSCLCLASRPRALPCLLGLFSPKLSSLWLLPAVGLHRWMGHFSVSQPTRLSSHFKVNSEWGDQVHCE